MAKKSVKLYTDNVLEEFYNHVLNGTVKNLHIPHSDVFYVRVAIEDRLGIRYSLEHIETAMKQQGWKK